MIVWAFCAVAAGKSATIVYINGAKYYNHTVQAGRRPTGLWKTTGGGGRAFTLTTPHSPPDCTTPHTQNTPLLPPVSDPHTTK